MIVILGFLSLLTIAVKGNEPINREFVAAACFIIFIIPLNYKTLFFFNSASVVQFCCGSLPETSGENCHSACMKVSHDFIHKCNFDFVSCALQWLPESP